MSIEKNLITILYHGKEKGGSFMLSPEAVCYSEREHLLEILNSPLESEAFGWGITERFT